MLRALMTRFLRDLLHHPGHLDAGGPQTQLSGADRHSVIAHPCVAWPQYSNHPRSARFFSSVKGEYRCSIATSGGEINIDLAWVSASKPYLP